MSHCANSVKHYKTLWFRYVFISVFFLYLLNKQIIKHNFALYGAVGVDSWSVTRFFFRTYRPRIGDIGAKCCVKKINVGYSCLSQHLIKKREIESMPFSIKVRGKWF